MKVENSTLKIAPNQQSGLLKWLWDKYNTMLFFFFFFYN